MTKSDALKLKELCEHIAACADIWSKSGVSRVRSITDAAYEIRDIIDKESEKGQ